MSKIPDPNSQIENRKERRQRVFLSGLIFVPESHSTFDCLIKDISETGAKISIPAEALIPNRFLLVNVKGHQAYEVQSVRRTKQEMGLKILRPISLTEASSVEARHLRRLLVERLHR